VYATLATPAVCPRKLHHPITHAHSATCSGGTTCLVTKYIPPAVGYADTSSATVFSADLLRMPLTYSPELAMQNAIQDPINQHQTAVAGPPAMIGLPKVAGTDPKTPRIDMAYETVDHCVNSLRSSCSSINSSPVICQEEAPVYSQSEQEGVHRCP